MSKKQRESVLELIERIQKDAQQDSTPRRRWSLDEYVFDRAQQKFWDMYLNELYAPESVDCTVPRHEWPGEKSEIRPSDAIKNLGYTVDAATWWPGQPEIIENVNGTQIKEGARTYNMYRPPDLTGLRTDGDPQLWIDHVKLIYPREHEHFFDWAAHALQRPGEKVNHGVLMAGAQGIGKDAALLPLMAALGSGNAVTIDPDHVVDTWDWYLRRSLIIINEVRPYDTNYKTSAFYNKLKPLLASPPDENPMQNKNQHTIMVKNLQHVVMTSNEPLGMFVPDDDRRLYVMISSASRHDMPGGYYEALYGNLTHNGGWQAVVKWLNERDISGVDFVGDPPRTRGKEQMITSARDARRNLADDVIEQYFDQFGGEIPKVVFHKDLERSLDYGDMQFDDKDSAIRDLRKNNFHYKMAAWGYDQEPPPRGRAYWRKKRKGEVFASRRAFVHSSVPHEERLQTVLDELDKRLEGQA